MSFHSDQIANHIAQAFTYADEAERLAATGFVDADVGKVALQQSDSTFWILRTTAPLWGDMINAGGDSDFNAVSTYAVPFHAGSQVFEDSGATVDPATLGWTFRNYINVPSGPVKVGTTLELSEGGGSLILADMLDEQIGFSIKAGFQDATGSERPDFVDFGTASSFDFQTDDSLSLTANPLSFSIPVVIDPITDEQLTDRVTLRTGSATTNFRAKLTDNATGTIIRYLPSEAAWNGEAPGIDLATGDNTIFLAEYGTDTSTVHYLGYAPIVSQHGQTIDVEFIADGMHLKGDALGVPYLIANIHTGPHRDLALREHADRVQSTGILEGGLMSQASSTTVSWTAGRGQIISYADPEYPVIHDIVWDAVTGLESDYLATDAVVVFGYDLTGTLIQKLASGMGISDTREAIWFGSILHLNSTVADIFTAPANLGYDGVGMFEDFAALVIGPANVDGNVYGANGSNLSIDVLGGNAYVPASNFRNNPALPNVIALPSEEVVRFFKVYRSADPGVDITFNTTPTIFIDPGLYDDGSGAPQAVSSASWTIQRIFRARDGSTLVAYGQEVFSSKATAIEALGSEPFTEKMPLPLTLFRGSLVVKGNATDLSNTAQAEFFTQSSFRMAGAHSTSSSIPGITNPGGLNTNIQFNDSGTFGGNSDFTYDTSTKTVVLRSEAAGTAAFELQNNLSATGLSLEIENATGLATIDAALGNFTISTTGTDKDILLMPSGNVGIDVTGATEKLSVLGLINSSDGYSIGSELVLYANDADSTAVGFDALATTPGSSENTAIGYEALFANVGGSSNVAVGVASLSNNIGGNANTAIGLGAMLDNTSGSFNVAVGTDALYANLDGKENVAIGINSLLANEEGDYNTALGSSSGVDINSAAGTGANTLLGYNTGTGIVTGINNTILGANVTGLASTLSNNILIADGEGNIRIQANALGFVGMGIDPVSPLHLYEDTTNTDATAGLTIEQDGVGDAVMHYAFTGIQAWSTGADYSGSGHYKISGSDDLGSGAVLTATIAGRVSVGSEEPVSTFHINDNTAFIGSTIGLTIKQDGTGDALAQWYLSGGVRYLAGIDNSDDDTFKIEYGGFLSTDAAIQVNTNNEVGIGVIPDSKLHVYQSDNETGDQAGLTIEQGGTGDAIAQFLLTSGQRWVMGLSNAGGDAFEISSSINLGSNTRFVINTTGEVKITDSLSVGTVANPVSILHAYEDTANTDATAGITIEQDGAGDALAQFLLTGGTRYLAGIDNSDDDLFKLGYGASLSTDTALQVNTDNEVGIGGAPLAGFIANVEGKLIVQEHTEANTTNTPFGGRGQVQNRITYSQELDHANWALGGGNPPVVTPNNAIAPDGTMTAATVSIPGPVGGKIGQAALGLINGETYNVSGWLRLVSGGTPIDARLGGGGGSAIESWVATDRWQRFSSDLVATSSDIFDLIMSTANTPAVLEIWGIQISDGAGSKPYLKTRETALLTQTQGATVNNNLYISGHAYDIHGRLSAKPPEVVEVWSLDDMPQDAGDVVPEYKLYRFMQGIDWGTTRMRLENDAYALFEGADVFVTSQTYSGTLPWIYGDGTIRCAGNGMTWKITSDNATMFDITAGGWGMDYSTLMTTGDNCSLGTIVAPTVSDPLLGTRFISTRSLFQGFKTGLTLVNPGALHVDISFFYDAVDAVGPMLTIDGLTKAAIIEATEVTMASPNSSFLEITPTVENPVNCTNITLADGQSFFLPGSTGAVTLFADASVAAEAITSVTDSSGIARFNFAAPPTLFIGQQVTVSGFTTNAVYNGTHIISDTGTGYFEVLTIDFGSNETGSFLSNSVTVTSAGHGLSDEDAVLITETVDYNAGSCVYDTQTDTFRINAAWMTAETTGTWDNGSLTEKSKYVTTSHCGTQRDNKKLASIYRSNNVAATSTTGIGTYDPLNLDGAVVGLGIEEFTLIDDATGEVRYEGLNAFGGVLQASISVLKSGSTQAYMFRAYKTVGSGAFDPIEITRGITTVAGSITMLSSIELNPGDQFRYEVQALGTANDIVVNAFVMTAA